MTKRRPRLPANLKRLSAKAIEKHCERPIPPRVDVVGDIEEGLVFVPPYAPQDQADWEALLLQAFGTRSLTVLRYFLSTLARLCNRVSKWEGKGKNRTHSWVPDPDEFDAMLAIINSIKPRNEAQAAQAASLVALHLANMRLAERTIWTPDERTIATQVRVTRAFGDGLEQLGRIQGKRKSVKQTIHVETHKHQHQHIHYEGSGGDGAGYVEASATVPGQEQAHREPLRIASGQGSPRLSRSRRSSGDRGTGGRG